ncbi:hypothetical protein ABN034_02295 [Actinopolymorpha sp. B11F2]|uniref:hypothetical protein n=1 Tax=Actinopolymorpha sp. B11F2 TaxID=3160862 RepID=UPI0032E3926C
MSPTTNRRCMRTYTMTIGRTEITNAAVSTDQLVEYSPCIANSTGCNGSNSGVCSNDY